MPMNRAQLFDDRVCGLGEGIFWHPDRQAPFWFDILSNRLLSRKGDQCEAWDFPEFVSAAAVVDHDRLVVATASGLVLYDFEHRISTPLADFPSSTVPTRSNDGRCDPFGGFWISTIGLKGEAGAGAIYRFAEGRLTRLFNKITVPNAICFAPMGTFACFTDTTKHMIWRVELDSAGWPKSDPVPFVDMTAEKLLPDGAVIDSEGCLWVALWGAARVDRYDPQGRLLAQISLPAANASCPAFGGPDLRTLYVTSASVGLDAPAEVDGRTYSANLEITGQAEHRFRLKP